MTGLFRFWARLDVVAELGLDYKTCDRVIVWFMRIPTLGLPPFLKCEEMVGGLREKTYPWLEVVYGEQCMRVAYTSATVMSFVLAVGT